MIEFKKMHEKSFLFPREFWDTDSGGGTVRHVVTRRAGSCRPPCVSMSHQSVTYFLFFIHSNVSNENCRYNEMKSNMALSIGTYFTLIWKLKKIFTVVMKISRKLGCSSTKLFNQIFPLQRKKNDSIVKVSLWYCQRDAVWQCNVCQKFAILWQSCPGLAGLVTADQSVWLLLSAAATAQWDGPWP